MIDWDGHGIPGIPGNFAKGGSPGYTLPVIDWDGHGIPGNFAKGGGPVIPFLGLAGMVRISLS